MTKQRFRDQQKRLPDRGDEAADERTAFVTRLQAVAELVGSVNALAKRAGLSQAGLRGYLFGSEPTRPALYAVADAAGVSRSWLFNGDAPMFCEGSEREEEALEHVRRAWNAFGKEQGGGEQDLNEFAERYRMRDEGLGLPGWVLFAVPDPRSIIAGRSESGGEASQGLGPRPSSQFAAPPGLILAVATELRRIESRTRNSSSRWDKALDVVLDAACRDLLAGAVALGRTPDADIIRKVIDVQMWKLGLSDENLRRRPTQSEMAAA